MGDVNGGDREFAVQTLEVAAYLVPKFRIQIRQWFVEEECLRRPEFRRRVEAFLRK